MCKCAKNFSYSYLNVYRLLDQNLLISWLRTELKNGVSSEPRQDNILPLNNSAPIKKIRFQNPMNKLFTKLSFISMRRDEISKVLSS